MPLSCLVDSQLWDVSCSQGPGRGSQDLLMPLDKAPVQHMIQRSQELGSRSPRGLRWNCLLEPGD